MTISSSTALQMMQERNYFGTETVESLSTMEAGQEGLIKTISNVFEMNILKYGGQFNALKQGLYDLIESQGVIDQVKDVKKLNNNIDKLLGDTHIASFGDEVIPTVNGLVTPLPEFTKEIHKLFTNVNVYGYAMVDELDNIIAQFIGSKDTRAAFIQLGKDLEIADTFVNDVKVLIDSSIKGNHETAKVSTIVGNNAAYKESVKNIVETNKNFTNKVLAKIEDKVEDIEARFSILLKVLKDKEEPFTKEALDLLVKSLDRLSKFLTSLSALYYLHVRSMDVTLKLQLLIK